MSGDLVLAFSMVMVGGLLLTSVFRGRSLSEVVKGITSPYYEEAATALGAESVTASKSQLQQVVRKISAQRGWNPVAWEEVIQRESGWNPQARNPSSGAFGLGQALGSTQQEFPKMISPNPTTQLEGMAEYIASRYGSPSAAAAHERVYGWY